MTAADGWEGEDGLESVRLLHLGAAVVSGWPPARASSFLHSYKLIAPLGAAVQYGWKPDRSLLRALCPFSTSYSALKRPWRYTLSIIQVIVGSGVRIFEPIGRACRAAFCVPPCPHNCPAMPRIAQDCSAVTLTTVDGGGRRHELHLWLPASFPDDPPQATPPPDLPPPLLPLLLRPAGAGNEPRGGRGRGGGKQLSQAMECFRRALAACQDVWDCLEDFDTHAWVLEPPPPAHPSTAPERRSGGAAAIRRLRGGGACVRRRLALGQHCSVEVALDVERPRSRQGMQVTARLGACRL
eukprot:364496-Chlamydomonas_euryale.AAC.55